MEKRGDDDDDDDDGGGSGGDDGNGDGGGGIRLSVRVRVHQVYLCAAPSRGEGS